MVYGHILDVGRLDSSVNILGCFSKNMLVIEVNVEFSMMNGFMYKYMHGQQAIILLDKLYFSQTYFFFQISLNAVQLYKYYTQQLQPA